MKEGVIRGIPEPIFFRITGLWILAETGIGGFLHAAHLPFTGLLVGGLSMFCLGALARNGAGTRQILQSLLVVLVCKAMLSPHSPFTAYVAVAFQGLLASVLLPGKRGFRIRYLMFGFITFLESAFQRVLVMVFFFGSATGKALDVWMEKTVGLPDSQTLALALLLGYVGLHAVGGPFLAGYFARLFARIEEDPGLFYLSVSPVAEEGVVTSKSPRDKRSISGTWFGWMSLVIFLSLLAAPFLPDSFPMPEGWLRIVWIWVFFVTTWIWFLQPLLTRRVRQFLVKKGKTMPSVAHIQTILPEIQAFTRAAMNASGWTRPGLFFRYLTGFLFGLSAISHATNPVDRTHIER